MNIFKLSYLNIVRRKNQSLFTGLITMLTVLSFVLVLSIFFLIQSGLNTSKQRLGADIIVLPNQVDSDSLQTLFTGLPQTTYMDKDIENTLKSIEGIEKTTPQFFTTTIDSGCCSYEGDMRIVGIDQSSDFILNPWFKESKKDSLKDNEIIIGSNVESSLGNTISILSNMFNISGRLYETGSGMDDTIFMNIDKARELAKKNFSQNTWSGSTPENLVSSLLIKTSNDSDIEDIVKEINSKNLNVKAKSTSSSITDMKNQILSISKIILFLFFIILFISFLSLIGRFNSLVKERKKEIGFLRSLGLNMSEIFKLIIFEILILAGIGGFLGSVLGVILVNPAISLLKGAIVIPNGAWSVHLALISILIGILGSLILGLLSAVYPLKKISKLLPKEAISKGDIE